MKTHTMVLSTSGGEVINKQTLSVIELYNYHKILNIGITRSQIQ